MRVDTATRLEGLEEYYFSKKLEQIRQLIANGHDIINLGIGSPDLPPAPEVIQELADCASEPWSHQYQSYRGIPQFRQSIADFYQSRYHVSIDASSEVLPMMGSKEAITHISLAFLNVGDQVLIPELGYPTYTSVTKMVEAEALYFPLVEEENYAPDWAFLENLDTSKVKLMWVNYPHMPTGVLGNEAILTRLVAYAKRRNILLCHDNPYSFILNDHPRSIWSIPGARESCIELNSLSKTFNMAGWRVGWIVAQSEVIQSVLKVKSNMDSGMFKPIQLAACKALSLDDSWYSQLNATYQERLKVVYRLLDKLACQYNRDTAGMFVWARVPEGTSGEGLSDLLLTEHDLFITPGFIFGEAGREHIRVSLCSPIHRFEEAVGRMTT